MSNMIKDLVTLCNTNSHLSREWYFTAKNNNTMTFLGGDTRGSLTMTDRVKEAGTVDFELVIGEGKVVDHIVDSEDFAYDLMKVIIAEV